MSIGTLTVYFSNLEYIQNELCENREKPEYKCEGTCVLAQMMAESKSQSSQNKVLIEAKEINFVLGFNEIKSTNDSFSILNNNLIPHGVEEIYSLILAESTLDPPELLV